MSHEEFLKTNPTFEHRIEAFVNGVLSPDTKGIVLLSMREGTTYTHDELYKNVNDFTSGNFPLTEASAWQYLYGRPHLKQTGSLEGIGAAVKLQIKRSGSSDERLVVGFQKTESGKEFCDPVAILGIRFVNLLNKEKKEDRSLSRLFGSTSAPEDSDYRHGYVIYKVIRFLATHQESKFSHIQVAEGLPEISISVITRTLANLGKIGFIDEYSPAGEKEGNPIHWLFYKVNENMSKIELSEKIAVSDKFIYPHLLAKMLEEIDKDPKQSINSYLLAKKLDATYTNVTDTISALRDISYLETDFRIRLKQSEASANRFTILLWNELLGPIEKLASNLDPTLIERKIQYYRDNSTLFLQDMIKTLETYDSERNRGGVQGGQELRKEIMQVLRKPMKTGHITEDINVLRKENGKSSITRDAVSYQLTDNLITGGVVRKSGDGYYAPNREAAVTKTAKVKK